MLYGASVITRASKESKAKGCLDDFKKRNNIQKNETERYLIVSMLYSIYESAIK